MMQPTCPPNLLLLAIERCQPRPTIRAILLTAGNPGAVRQEFCDAGPIGAVKPYVTAAGIRETSSERPERKGRDEGRGSIGKSHSRTVRSQLPDAPRRPSAFIATLVTKLVCPWNVRKQRPVATSQNRTVQSQLPDSAHCVSPLRGTEATSARCPSKSAGNALT